MTLKLAAEPEITVVSWGWVVTTGVEAVFTESIAALLVVMAEVFHKLSFTATV